MNKEFKNPNTVEQWWGLAKQMRLLNPPNYAKVYINSYGNFQVSWKTEEQIAKETKAAKALVTSANRRRYAELKLEMAKLEEALNENITKD